MSRLKALEADALCRRCDEASLTFETTDEVADLPEVIGQARAVAALRFGVGIDQPGYNLCVVGPSGIGKYSLVRQYLEPLAAAETRPPDWCYVNNFRQPHKPIAIKLPAGRGRKLRRDMEQLVEELRTAIPATFETEEYQLRVHEIKEEFKERRQSALNELGREAEAHGIALIPTPGGFAFAPIRDGKVIEAETYEKLSKEDKDEIETLLAHYQEQLANILRQVPQWRREARERLKVHDREIAILAVGSLLEETKKLYTDIPAVLEYLDTVEHDVLENVDAFRTQEEASGALQLTAPDASAFRPYRVNVIVDHDEAQGAPVVYEDNPLFQNLVGRTEHQAQFGALVTDFNLIKPGALHQANGGYLILDLRKVLMQPYAWEGLKRALFSRKINIESLGQIFSVVSTVSLEPEPIPLGLKVVLLGDRLLYYLLHAYDPDFSELFKVEADFENDFERDAESHELYARMIATLLRKEHLLPMDRGAVARVIEYSARIAGDAYKLSAHILSVVDLLREADYWTRAAGRDVATRADVQHAIDAQLHRENRVQASIYEEIRRGIILIDTRGEKSGQVNGLSVVTLGKFSFGQPSRITATVRLGEGEVVDIEREVDLGGAIHSKGVLILASYLGARYSSDAPLSLSASLVFEQSYGEVEGDSASAAELVALLSALAQVPVRQSVAVTGSVNQHGEIQAIGGINEKIEGFFDVCRAAGFTGDQCVLIPASNVQHLMLREDVVQAAEIGQFRVFAITTIDEALEILTGMPTGARDKKGLFPVGTFNHRVQARLRKFAQIRKEYSQGDKD